MVTETLLTWIARFISGASVRWVQSQPDTCQRVYFANHTSHLDFVAIWGSLPRDVRMRTRPVAGRDEREVDEDDLPAGLAVREQQPGFVFSVAIFWSCN